MEADISTYAASYVLARIAIFCTFGYVFYRVMARSRHSYAKTLKNSGDVKTKHMVADDRC